MSVYIRCFLLFSLFFNWTPDCDAQSRDSDEIAITWGVETNFLDGNLSRATMELTNRGSNPLPADGWSLYFNFLRMIDTENLPETVSIQHINGDFYRLNPGDHFRPLEPGDKLTFTFDVFGPMIKEIDAPDGMYFVFDDYRVEQVQEVDILPFSEEEQLNRSPNDRVIVPDSESEFYRFETLQLLDNTQVGRITPRPYQTEKLDESIVMTNNMKIFYHDGLEVEAGFLSDAIENLTGFSFPAEMTDKTPAATLTGNEIFLAFEELSDVFPNRDNRKEAYKLSVEENGIHVTAEEPAGIFYGIQSLRALINTALIDKAGSEVEETIESIEIKGIRVMDLPRFGYRGLHLDVSRNFQPVEKVKMLLDLMGLYKLNRFHFHLTDDEGWRLESTAFPELTEIGGRRGHTLDEKDHLYPSYGSGPDPDDPGSLGSGWYSVEEYIDLLQFAAKRHIEVIPEIDVPGHARAALVAMQNRYERLIEEGRTDEAERYRIHDPEDTSEYRSIQNWDDNVINVCQESTYRFLDVIFEELIGMHEEAGVPLYTIHIGGDEVPHGVWEESPECHRLIEENEELESVDELQVYFFSKLAKLLNEKGLVMAGWEEIALIEDSKTGTKQVNPDLVPTGSVPHVWSNIWGAGTEEYAYQLANTGYNVVMSHASNFYFDLAYNKDPRESGFYWAGFVDTRDPFSFIPYDLYKNADVNSYGNAIPEDAYESAERLTGDGQDRILGLQGQLWGETFRKPERVDYMAFPRVIALSERAWAPQPEWALVEEREERNNRMVTEWNEFTNRLGRFELPHLDRLHGGVAYRLPPPGAVIQDGQLYANTAYPGLNIRFTLDGSEPGLHSEVYDGPVDVTEADTIRLQSFDTNGRGSRIVSVENKDTSE